MLKGTWRDLVYAARSLGKAPAFAFVCIVSLGIGMAPVIAVPYLARIPRTPPPGVNTDGLVEMITTAKGTRPAGDVWSYPDYMDLRRAATGIAIFGWANAPDEIELPTGTKAILWPMYVSAGYFKTLGVRLVRGPGFEGQAGAAVILGYQFWENSLGSDPQIVGKTLKIDNVPYVVAGIAPDQFQGHLSMQGRELFIPLERYPLLLADRNARVDRGKEWLHIHGRLLPGVSVAQASAEIAGITARLAKEYPATNKLKAGIAEPYDSLGVLFRSQFRVLEAAGLMLTGALLLVVCLNLAGMMQVRSAMRERELSIRQAVGASRFRLARLLLCETVLLAAVGGALASAALFHAPTVISRLTGHPIPAAVQGALRPGLSTIAICAGLCLLTSLVFGFLPAMRFSRPVVISSLKDDAGAGGLRAGRVHRYTAALQVAIAVPLLVMSAIGLDRVRSTATADLGFQSDLVYAAPLELNDGPEANNAAAMDSRLRSLRDNLGKANGIASVTVADGLPLDFGGRGTSVSPQTGVPALVHVQATRVGDDYLKTMGIPLLSGRDFSGDDTAGSERVTIITKRLADQLFAKGSANGGMGEAIGKRLKLGAGDGDAPAQTVRIVGVAGDFPTSQMTTDRAQVLLPLVQNFRRNTLITDDDGNRIPNLFLIGRSKAGEPPEKIAAELEAVVQGFDPGFRRAGIVTGVSLRKKSMDDLLTGAAVAGGAGGVALLLSALGIYGVVGLMVAARRREIAVRVALGASRRRVVGMILFDVVKLTAPGVVAGLILTAVFIHFNGERVGIALSDAETLAYAAGGAIAIVVAVIASLVPALRAASVPPMVAMRSE